MKTPISLVLLFYLPGVLAFGQSTEKKGFTLMGAEVGYGLYRYHDPVQLTLPQEKGHFASQFRWITDYGKFFDSFTFSYFSSETQPISSTISSAHRSNNFYIDYAFHFPVVKKQKWDLFLGPMSVFYVSIRDLQYANEQTAENHEFFASFNLSTMLRINMQDNMLIVSANNPAFAIVTQRKYSLNDSREEDLLYFPDFNSLGLNTVYYQHVSGIFYLSLGYSLYYFKYPKHSDIQATKGNHHKFITGIHFKF